MSTDFPIQGEGAGPMWPILYKLASYMVLICKTFFIVQILGVADKVEHAKERIQEKLQELVKEDEERVSTVRSYI